MKTQKLLGLLTAATLGAVLTGCSPTQKDPPFAGIMNRQDVDVSQVALAPDSNLSRMGVANAWKGASGKMPDGTRVIVAVIGTGVDYNIEDIRESLWVNTGELGDRQSNYADDDNNQIVDDLFGYDFYSGDPMPFDWYGHDTLTASLITSTGRKNASVIGAAPNAALMILRYLGPDGRGNGPGAQIDASAAIEYAVANKAKIIYLNWPQGGFGSDAQLVVSAIKAAAAANVLVVIPAGNSSNKEVPGFLGQVASLDQVVVVAGVDAQGKLSSRTNYGKSLASVAAYQDNANGYMPGGHLTKDLSTTSVAAAYTAGIAALYASLPGNGSAAKIKQALLSGKSVQQDGLSLDVLSEGVLSVSLMNK